LTIVGTKVRLPTAVIEPVSLPTTSVNREVLLSFWKAHNDIRPRRIHRHSFELTNPVDSLAEAIYFLSL
jgi:hypothetical protein